MTGCERDAPLADYWEKLHEPNAPRDFDSDALPALDQVERTLPTSSEASALFDGMSFADAADAAFWMLYAFEPDATAPFRRYEDRSERNAWPTSYTAERMQEESEVAEALLAALQAVDISSLNRRDATMHGLLVWFLEDRMAWWSFVEHGYPINAFYPLSTLDTALEAFTLETPLTSIEDCQDFLLRLQAIQGQFDEIIVVLGEQENAGIRPPYQVLYSVLDSIGRVTLSKAFNAPRTSELYRSFVEGMRGIDTLNAEEVEAYTFLCEQTLIDSAYPAYAELNEVLYALRHRCSPEQTLVALPRGNELFAWLLSHYAGTATDPEQVHEAALAAVDDAQKQIRTMVEELDGPADAPLDQVIDWVESTSGLVRWNDLRDAFAAKDASMKQSVRETFVRRELPLLTLVFYDGDPLFVPEDEEGNGGELRLPTRAWYPAFRVTSTAFREGFPGRAFQYMMTGTEFSTPLHRTETFASFAEGWPAYADTLAWEAGLYEGDVLDSLGYHYGLLLDAAMAAVDTGLHSRGWTANQATEFFVEAAGNPTTQSQKGWGNAGPGEDRGKVVSIIEDDSIAPGVINQSIAEPGILSACFVGRSEFLRLHADAELRMGERFSLQDYLEFVLEMGPLPMGVLEQRVKRYVDDAAK